VGAANQGAAVRGSASDGGSGWRRFGDPASTNSAPSRSGVPMSPASPRPVEPQANQRRRFGDTGGQGGRAPQSGSPSVAPSPGSSDRGNSWRRFGDPSASTYRSAPSPGIERQGSGNRGWGRFGDPSGTAQRVPDSPRFNQRNQGYSAPAAPRYSAPRQESLRMDRPAVRERSAAPYRPNGGGGGGSARGGGAPSGGGSSRGGGSTSGGGGRGSHGGGRNR